MKTECPTCEQQIPDSDWLLSDDQCDGCTADAHIAQRTVNIPLPEDRRIDLRAIFGDTVLAWEGKR